MTEKDVPFKFLGYDLKYHYFKVNKDKIVKIEFGKFNGINILEIAKGNYWQENYPSHDYPFNLVLIVDWLISESHKVGFVKNIYQTRRKK